MSTTIGLPISNQMTMGFCCGRNCVCVCLCIYVHSVGSYHSVDIYRKVQCMCRLNAMYLLQMLVYDVAADTGDNYGNGSPRVVHQMKIDPLC